MWEFLLFIRLSYDSEVINFLYKPLNTIYVSYYHMINKNILKECCDEGFNEHELYESYKIFFGTLVSEPRLKIINLLKKKSLTVSKIIDELKMDQTAVSHNLKRLRECGFVISEVDGKFRRYKLNDTTIRPLMEIIEKHMKGNCIHILRNMKEDRDG